MLLSECPGLVRRTVPWACAKRSRLVMTDASQFTNTVATAIKGPTMRTKRALGALDSVSWDGKGVQRGRREHQTICFFRWLVSTLNCLQLVSLPHTRDRTVSGELTVGGGAAASRFQTDQWERVRFRDVIGMLRFHWTKSEMAMSLGSRARACFWCRAVS